MKKKNVRKTLAGVMALSILSGQLVTAAEVVSSVDTVPAEMYNENLDIAPEMDEVINALTPEPDIPSVQPSADPIVMTSANPVPPMPAPAPEDVPVFDDPFTEGSYEEEEKLYEAFSAAKSRLYFVAEALFSGDELSNKIEEINERLANSVTVDEIELCELEFTGLFLETAEEKNDIELYRLIAENELRRLEMKYVTNETNSQARDEAASVLAEGLDKLENTTEIVLINEVMEVVEDVLVKIHRHYESVPAPAPTPEADTAELEEAKETSKKKIMEYAESVSSERISFEAEHYCRQLEYARTVDEINSIEERALAEMYQIYEEENNYDLIKERYSLELKDILRRMKNPSEETIKFAESSIEKIMNAEDKETGTVIYKDAYDILMMEFRAELKAAIEKSTVRITEYAESTGSAKVIAVAKEQVTNFDYASSIDSIDRIESSILQDLREIYEDELPGATKWHIYQSIPAEQKMEITDDGVFHISVIESEGADHEKWDLRFRRKNLNFKKEHEYQISFKVKSKRDEMELTSKIGNIRGDEEYFVLDGDKGMVIGPHMGGFWGRALSLSTDWQEITGTFVPSKDIIEAEWAFEYAAGNFYEGNAVDGDEIWFRDISVVCSSCDGVCLTEPAAVQSPDPNAVPAPNATTPPVPVPSSQPSAEPPLMPSAEPTALPAEPTFVPAPVPDEPEVPSDSEYQYKIQEAKADILDKTYQLLENKMISESDKAEVKALMEDAEKAETIEEIQETAERLRNIAEKIKFERELFIVSRENAYADIKKRFESDFGNYPEIMKYADDIADRILKTEDSAELEQLISEADKKYNEYYAEKLAEIREKAIAGIRDAENKFWRITPDVKTFAAECTEKIMASESADDIEKISEGALSKLQELLKAEVLPVLVPAKEASHTEDGSRAYYTYEGRFYEDYDCTAEIKDIETWSVVAAEGHKFGSWKITVLPTSDHDGVKERSCEVCNEVEKTSTTFNKPVKTESDTSSDKPQEDTGVIQVVTKPESNAMSAEVDIKTSDLIESLPLSIEEMTMIENGSVVSVAMNSKDITEQADPVEKKKVEEVLAPEQKIAAVIDVTVEKFIDGAFTGNVTEFKAPINVAIEIPQELIKKDREFAIARVHNGEVQLLTLTQLEGTKFTFGSDMFSSYYIVYNDIHTEHTFTEWTTVRNASWTHSGVEIRTCPVDGVTETRVTQKSKIERAVKAVVKLVKRFRASI